MKQETNGNEFQLSKHDSIFALVKINGKVRIAVGNNIVSQKEFETYKDAEMYISRKPYELLINIACLIFDKRKENEKSKESDKSNKENQ